MSSYLIYGMGSEALKLDMVDVREWAREAEYDGPTYLWHRHRLHVTGVLNPEATSFRQAGAVIGGGFVGGANLVQGAGSLAPMTDVAIRERMLLPRKNLRINTVGEGVPMFDIGPATVEMSLTNITADGNPRTPVTDSNNGPIPRAFNVIEASGATSWTVEWVVEFCLIQSTRAAGLVTVISHRWTMEDAIDMPHYLTTRTITGHAILRTDEMLRNGVVPDDFRAALFHPINANTQRMAVHVAAHEDGNRLDYAITDVEQLVNLEKKMNDLGITKIECTHNAEINKPGAEDAIVAFAGSAMQTLNRALIAGSAAVPTMGASVLSLVPITIMGGIDLGLTAMQLVPRQTHTVITRVYGNAFSVKDQMIRTGIDCCWLRMRPTSVNVRLAANWFQVTVDVMGKWVEVQLRVKAGLDAIVQSATQIYNDAISVSNTRIAGVNIPFVTRFDPMAAISNWVTANILDVTTNIMPIDEIIPGYSILSDGTNTNDNPRPPEESRTRQVQIAISANGTRGTMLAKLAAQVLVGDYALTPSPPPAPPLASNRPIR